MSSSPIASRLVQAQAHAEADPRPTTLKLWRDGVEVQMWDGGRRITKRVSWAEIETAHVNPLPLAVDACSAELSKRQ